MLGASDDGEERSLVVSRWLRSTLRKQVGEGIVSLFFSLMSLIDGMAGTSWGCRSANTLTLALIGFFVLGFTLTRV